MLRIESISKTYSTAQGQHLALDGINLEIQQGQILALLARNGAGKSTLISIIAGLMNADKGHIQLGEHKLPAECCAAAYRAQSLQQTIGLAGQETGIYPGLTLDQNLHFFAELYRVPKKEINRRTDEVLDLLGLRHLRCRLANQLSGGEKRRLHAGCAIMHKPKLLLMDEPTVGADPVARTELLNAVNALASEGTAVLYTSHYLPEIEQLGAYVTVMDKGRVLAQGSQQELLNSFGEAEIHLEFSSAAPKESISKCLPSSQWVSQNKLLIKKSLKTDPKDTFTIPSILENLGDLRQQLTGINHREANLEQAFFTLLGNSYS